MTQEQFNKAKNCFDRKNRVEEMLEKLDKYKLRQGNLYFKDANYSTDQINLQCPPSLLRQIFDLVINYYTDIKDEIDKEIENI